MFVQVPGKRCYILGVSESAGHAAAADWIVARVQEGIRHRQMVGPPTPVSEIVDLLGPSELMRRDINKVFLFFKGLQPLAAGPLL